MVPPVEFWAPVFPAVKEIELPEAVLSMLLPAVIASVEASAPVDRMVLGCAAPVPVKFGHDIPNEVEDAVPLKVISPVMVPPVRGKKPVTTGALGTRFVSNMPVPYQYSTPSILKVIP